MSELAKWYVINTYSGYENKVCSTIEQAVENRKLHNLIHKIVIPMETVEELKNGEVKEVSKKLFPGYVMLKMVLNDDSWIVVRNTRGVTGFVGADTKPTPLSENEVKRFGLEKYDDENTTSDIKRELVIPFNITDSVRVEAGPLEGSIGIVSEIDREKGTVLVLISMFGRETPAELDIASVKPLAI